MPERKVKISRAKGVSERVVCESSHEEVRAMGDVRRGASQYAFLEWSWPRLHEGKSWYVDFMQFDPVKGRMRRKKYMLDGITSIRDRRRRANELIHRLAERLADGWNVWAENAQTSRSYTTIDNVWKYYYIYMEKMVRSGVMRESSVKRYYSYMKCFREWLEKMSTRHVVYSYMLDRSVVVEFLDYLLLDIDVTPTTRNNYLTWLGTLSEWMLSRGYVSSSPVEGLKAMREEVKKREPLTREMLRTLFSHLEDDHPHFLLACYLLYFAMVRPTELTYVRVGDVDVNGGRLFLRGEHTKNNRDAVVALNSRILKLMKEIGIFNHPSCEYLFGDSRFIPGEKRVSPSLFRIQWQMIRNEFGWEDCFQFYSLKDSGIRDLATSAGVVVARDQARHSSVATTNKYIKGRGMTVHEEAKHFDVDF